MSALESLKDKKERVRSLKEHMPLGNIIADIRTLDKVNFQNTHFHIFGCVNPPNTNLAKRNCRVPVSEQGIKQGGPRGQRLQIQFDQDQRKWLASPGCLRQTLEH